MWGEEGIGGGGGGGGEAEEEEEWKAARETEMARESRTKEKNL